MHLVSATFYFPNIYMLSLWVTGQDPWFVEASKNKHQTVLASPPDVFPSVFPDVLPASGTWVLVRLGGKRELLVSEETANHVTEAGDDDVASCFLAWA